MSKIYRLHYRGQLRENVNTADLQSAVNDCVEAVRKLQTEGKILTAALYYADKMLFLYYEAVGEPLPVAEPAAIQPPLQKAWEYGGIKVQELPGRQFPVDGARSSANDGTTNSAGNSTNSSAANSAVVEAGEDVLAAVPHPTEFLAPLAPFLMSWPGQRGERLWVHMYHIYYHSVPEKAETWKRAAIPEKRRGRIAFLRDDKLFSYVYFHRAIVEEGLLTGDKYQSIALHENILFSYFEEPKTFTNVQNNVLEESRVIEDWLAVNPESHFIHMQEGEGENFMFLPALFALGVEDAAE